MDFSKKYDISVYLTEEQLNKAYCRDWSANHRKIQGTVSISHLHTQGLNILYH